MIFNRIFISETFQICITHLPTFEELLNICSTIIMFIYFVIYLFLFLCQDLYIKQFHNFTVVPNIVILLRIIIQILQSNIDSTIGNNKKNTGSSQLCLHFLHNSVPTFFLANIFVWSLIDLFWGFIKQSKAYQIQLLSSLIIGKQIF
jgi:hypothetical protein